MKPSSFIALACIISLTGSYATAGQSEPELMLAKATGAPSTAVPAAGVVPLGVTVIQMQAVVVGWSAKRDLIAKGVQNDKNEKLGKIEDIIISPRNSASFAIIGVGGFLGIGGRLVAIPMTQLRLQSGQLVLRGATKDALKAMPPFIYAH